MAIPTTSRGRAYATVPSIPVILAAAASVLALAGVAISGYLALQNLQGEAGVCTVTHGCATVQKSRYGELLGVPVSVPGLGLYLALAISGSLRLARPGSAGSIVTPAALLAAFAGLAFSAYLTAVEAFVLEAWCIYCIGSALIISTLFVVWLALLIIDRRSAR